MGYARVLGPLDVKIATKLVRNKADDPPVRGKQKISEGAPTNGDRATFTVNKELLYDGKGKSNTIGDNLSNESNMGSGDVDSCEGLEAPCVNETGEAITGDMRKIMRRDNKQCKQQLKLQQKIVQQWSIQGTFGPIATGPPTEPLSTYRNSMCPTGRALHHPVAEMLNQWATFGCPTHTGQPWSKRKCGRQSREGPTNRRCHQPRSSILPRRRTRKYGPIRPALYCGTTSKMTHPHS